MGFNTGSLQEDPEPRIQPQGVSTGRQREQGGRPPPKGEDLFSAKEGLAELRQTLPSFPHQQGSAGTSRTPTSPERPGRKDPKKSRREREGAARRSHAASRAGRHHVVPAAEECREGGTRLTPAHTHTPDRAARTRLPPRAPRRCAERPGRAARAARGPAARRMAPNCHPPVRPGPATPSPATTRPQSCPLTRLTFPLTGRPAHSPSGSLTRRKVPRIRRGKAPNSMTRWVSSSPHSPRNRPLEPVAHGHSTA